MGNYFVLNNEIKSIHEIKIYPKCDLCLKIKNQYGDNYENTVDKINIINMDEYNGWFCCNNEECKKYIKKSIIEHVRKNLIIPLYWLYLQKKSLKIYNARMNKIVDCELCEYQSLVYVDESEGALAREKSTLAVKLSIPYKITYPENTITGFNFLYIALGNIFRCNPYLYQILKAEKHIFGNDIEINYDELPENFKQLVEKAYLSSLTNEKYSSIKFDTSNNIVYINDD
jgi:hypothetical protein